MGPVAVYLGEGPASCAGEYPEPFVRGGKDLRFSAAECDCGCGSVEGVACGSARLRYLEECEGNGLVTAFQTLEVAGTCYPQETLDVGWMIASVSAETSRAACQPSASVELRAATWTLFQACSGSMMPGCEATEVCAPAPPAGAEEDLCIVRRGDFPCPTHYSEGRLLHEKFVDERGCDDCRCSDPSGISCTRQVATYASSDCEGGGLLIGLDACVPRIREWISATEPSVTGGCEPNSPSSQGSVVLQDPITVCCMT